MCGRLQRVRAGDGDAAVHGAVPALRAAGRRRAPAAGPAARGRPGRRAARAAGARRAGLPRARAGTPRLLTRPLAPARLICDARCDTILPPLPLYYVFGH